MAALVQSLVSHSAPEPQAFTRQEVAEHSFETDCWIIVEDKVYDVTKFLEEHPGGSDIILCYAGYDATSAFYDKGHSRDAKDMLSEYYIGNLIE